MNENFSNSGDEILEASLSAMRARAVPDGPSEARMAETIAAMKLAERKPNTFWRMNNMKLISGMAASVLLVIGAVVVAILMLRSPEVTCAEVVDTVRNAHLMSFVVTTGVTPNAPPMRMTMVENDQGQMSVRSSDGTRMVMDRKTGHMVVEEPSVKTAVVMDMKNFPKRSNDPRDLIEQFKKLQGNSATDLGRTEIDGRKAEKFHAMQEGSEYTIWADPYSHEPIRVDVLVSVMDKKMTVSMGDFEFNPTVPDGEFKLDIPPGYAVQNISFALPNIDDGEQNTVDLLRGYAEESGGKFPPKLDDMSPFMKLAMSNATTRTSDADIQMIVRCQYVRHFLGTLPSGQWKYLGDGKTMGDSHALIFWYKFGKGNSAEYRGIFGDLVFRDLPAAPQ
jgi:outer membrane lipoprotein-sorting protein